MQVVKIGGRVLDRPRFQRELPTALSRIEGPFIIVHGGGRVIDALQTRLGHRVTKVRGLRVTDREGLEIAQMALCGLVNKQLVSVLLGAGIDAIGMCGVDGGLLRVRKVRHPGFDLGLVGEIAAVRTALLQNLLAQAITPVIAPISLGVDGEIYNVNADHAASALAQALGAQRLHLVSDVPGVLLNGEVLPRLSLAMAKEMIDNDQIQGGMLPKLKAAVQAVEGGMPQVIIGDLAGLEKGGGTAILKE